METLPRQPRHVLTSRDVDDVRREIRAHHRRSSTATVNVSAPGSSAIAQTDILVLRVVSASISVEQQAIVTDFILIRPFPALDDRCRRDAERV